jgi:hypothetical protein
MQKYQEEMKDNPSKETKQFCRDNGIRQDLSNPGIQFKTERQRNVQAMYG